MQVVYHWCTLLPYRVFVILIYRIFIFDQPNQPIRLSLSHVVCRGHAQILKQEDGANWYARSSETLLFRLREEILVRCLAGLWCVITDVVDTVFNSTSRLTTRNALLRQHGLRQRITEHLNQYSCIIVGTSKSTPTVCLSSSSLNPSAGDVNALSVRVYHPSCPLLNRLHTASAYSRCMNFNTPCSHDISIPTTSRRSLTCALIANHHTHPQRSSSPSSTCSHSTSPPPPDPHQALTATHPPLSELEYGASPSPASSAPSPQST